MEQQKYNEMNKVLDPTGDFKNKQTAAQNENLLNQLRAERSNSFEQASREYNDKTNYEESAIKMNATASYISDLQENQQEENLTKMGRVGADLMTIRRVATINRENYYKMYESSQYMKITLTFLCIAAILMAVGIAGYLSVKVTKIILAVLAGVWLLVVLAKLFGNFNRYRMLSAEKVFPLVDIGEDDVSTEECACPTS
jgi:lipopolysaccharide export LptBFGC system permease protein LptF